MRKKKTKLPVIISSFFFFLIQWWFSTGGDFAPAGSDWHGLETFSLLLLEGEDTSGIQDAAKLPTGSRQAPTTKKLLCLKCHSWSASEEHNPVQVLFGKRLEMISGTIENLFPICEIHLQISGVMFTNYQY